MLETIDGLVISLLVRSVEGGTFFSVRWAHTHIGDVLDVDGNVRVESELG